MNSCRAWGITLVLCLTAAPVASGEPPTVPSSQANPQPAEPAKQPFNVRVLDPDGRPVPAALVGQGAGREGEVGGDWIFAGYIESERWHPFVTDANGITQMFAEHFTRDAAVIVARVPARKLVGMLPVKRADLLAAHKNKSALEILLKPECRVHGRLKSTGLEQHDQELEWTNVNLSLDGRTVFECSSTAQEFEFFLPPGIYSVEAYGQNTLSKVESFDVPAIATERELEVIDLPPAPLAKLIGQPAPELAGVLAWKNSEPLKLVDLRGKYVLLEFFGHWSGPCVHRMPEQFELHDRFAKRGLVIIGVHVGLEDESIDSEEKLDAALALSRKELWDGRDIPFPVAMVASSRQKFGDSDQTSRSQVGADYGIRSYPSQVLIDTAGNVVGWFDEVEHLKLFEKLPE
jgi:thiol-disulfide isomerase/thioredoxin